MVSYYPEVKQQEAFIEKVVRTEEERFHETINDGLTMLNDVLADLKDKNETTLDGKVIFKLYDTFGFPVELTEEVAEDEGLKVDHEGFEVEMQAQKERARAARTTEKSMGVQTALLGDIKVDSKFVGYDHLEIESELLVILQDNAMVSTVEEGEAKVIFAETPFYAEMGGQIADKGILVDQSGKIIANVTDVQKAPNGQALHTVEVLESLNEGDKYFLQVNAAFRNKVIKTIRRLTYCIKH